MAAQFKPSSAMALCEHEELASLTHTKPKTAPAHVPRWKRKQEQAAAAGLKTNHTGQTVNTPNKKPKASPSKAAAAAPSSSKKGHAADRFIPNRSNMDMAHANFSLSHGAENAIGPAIDESSNDGNVSSRDTSGTTVGGGGSSESAYQKRLDSALGNGCSGAVRDASGINDGKHFRILSFKDKAPVNEDYQSNNVLYSSNRHLTTRPVKSSKVSRHIPSAPIRILDAPDLMDDYYLNLVDWSPRDIIAVALGPAVYLWNHKSGSIDELMALPNENDYICSLKWIPGGTHLAVGTSDAMTQLWDVEAMRQLRGMNGHTDRISCLSWNEHMLSSGSKDATIVNHDVRIRDHHVATLNGHEQEVCGLAWSLDGQTLASGGNDNKLMIWDAASTAGRSQRPRFKIGEHMAAVKALAWSPHERNLIASGGGTADRCIKFFNTQTGSMINSIDTGSQVCSLLWSPHEKEILSSHGFSRNEINLWRYPSMVKVKELTGHTARVLHMAASPDGASVVSAGADETLRFWDIFGGPPEKKKASTFSDKGFANSMSSIR